MINSVTSAQHALSDRLHKPVARARKAEATKVQPAARVDAWRGHPDQGPSAPFVAQLLGQRDEADRPPAQPYVARLYAADDQQEVFGPDADIQPTYAASIDIRV